MRQIGSDTSLNGMICEAIRSRVLIAFDYDGMHRVVAPYCHGFTTSGEALRAVQVRGESRSGGLGTGKLWKIEKMLNARRTMETFEPDDPQYNQYDQAMTRIHCHIRR